MPELLSSQFAKLALENLTHFVPARLADCAGCVHVPTGRNRFIETKFVLQDSLYANTSDHAPMHPRRCRKLFSSSPASMNGPALFLSPLLRRTGFQVTDRSCATAPSPFGPWPLQVIPPPQIWKKEKNICKFIGLTNTRIRRTLGANDGGRYYETGHHPRDPGPRSLVQ
jgi:hypothetical protein